MSDTASDIKSPKLSAQWQSLLLAVIPAVVLAVLFLIFYLPMAAQQSAAQRASDLAEVRVNMLDNNLQQLADHLDGLGRLPQLRLAMRDSNADALKQFEDDFALQFAHLNRIALFPLGELGVARLGDYGAKLKNNIEKDILRRAAGNEEVLLDTYALDGRQVYSLARPVYAGDRSIGAILLTLEGSWLASQLEDQRTDSQRTGVTELIYQIGSSAPVNITPGIPGLLSDQVITGEASLASNPNIRVKYHVLDAPIVIGTPAMVLLGAMFAAALLAVFAVARVFRSVHNDVSHDLEHLNRSVEDPAGAEATDYRIPAFNAVTQTIQSSLVRVDTAPTVEKTDSAPAEEETTLWANPQVAGGMVVDDETSEDDAALLLDGLANDSGSVTALPAHIFRAYDIRGNADAELTDDGVMQIAKAIGTTALRAGQRQIIVGRDGRLSSQRIQTALIDGLLATGCDVIDIGLVATPMLYYAVESQQTQAGVMVTGSHNPAEINGLKIVLNGQALAEQQIVALADLANNGDFEQGQGALSSLDIADSYIDQIAEDVVVASSFKVVLDCCNGAASEIAPMLYASLGCEVVPLYAEVDGSFPNHAPDPSVADNLSALVDEVMQHGADLGLAFDGDADRMVAVTSSGRIVDADQILMLFAKDVLTRNPGADVVYDIKSSRHLNQVIAGHGGRPVMWKSGHSLMKQKMHETDALLGGEFSGHFFFKERWYGFDDGLYSGTRLIEFLTLEGISLDEMIDALPNSFSTPEIHLPVAEDNKMAIIDMLQGTMSAEDGQLTTMDGIRVDYAEGWGLVRASNTSSSLTMRFEANSESALEDIKSRFRDALASVAPDLASF